MWLECIGVVRDVIIIIVTFPYSTCISSFLEQQHPYFVHIKIYYFFVLFMLFLCNIANVAQRTFEIVQKSRSCEHGDIINYIDKNIERMSTARARVPRLPRARYRVTFQESCS